MNNKILITAIYPAPYRVELINLIRNRFSADVFFDYSNGDNRNDQWFTKGDYYLIDNGEGRKKFHQAIINIKKYSLVILYDYTTKNSIFLISLCKTLSIPYVLNADGVMITDHGSLWREKMKKFLISGAAGYFSSGKRAKEYFEKYGAKSGKIYTHTFSTLHHDDILDTPPCNERIISLRQKLGVTDCKRIAVAVGRFIPLKRFDHLIQSWIDMPAEYHLIVIGGGSEEDNYRNIILKNHLNNVSLEGFHSKKELYDYYQAADVLVHPTSYDVWGLVINEAMANGLPIVVSDHCVAGLELIKNGENGFLFELDDHNTMKNYIKLIFENDELRYKMREEALATIKQYTIENMADNQIAAIEGIINND